MTPSDITILNQKLEIEALRSRLDTAIQRAEAAEARIDEAERIASARVKQNEEQIRIHFANTREWREALDTAEAKNAELREVLGIMTPPVFHNSVPSSWEIYTAFSAGGSLHRYTVDQAKRAQKLMGVLK